MNAPVIAPALVLSMIVNASPVEDVKVQFVNSTAFPRFTLPEAMTWP